eukprot:m.31335 g.31335  ORF g.31335 m.31335 type:complete len:825 (+) comp5345_c0_seq1:1471-3945(+)
METLTFAVLDHQEMEITESEIAHLERSIELDRFEAIMKSLEAEYAALCEGRLNYCPTGDVLFEYQPAAEPEGKMIVSSLHTHPLKYSSSHEPSPCANEGSKLGCAVGSSSSACGMFVCASGCSYSLCIDCSKLQQRDVEDHQEVRRVPFHNHKLVAVTPPPGFSCLCSAVPEGCENAPAARAFVCANGCDFAICASCTRLPMDAYSLHRSALHCHPLVRHTSSHLWLCDGRYHRKGCGNRDPIEPGHFVERFRCTAGCDFDLCGQCIQIVPVPREEVRLSYMHPHPLALSHRQGHTWSCSASSHPRGCSQSSFDGWSPIRHYRCELGCDYELCEECVELEPPMDPQERREEIDAQKRDLAARLVITRLTYSIARFGDQLILAKQNHASSGIIHELECELELHSKMLATAESSEFALERMMDQEEQLYLQRGAQAPSVDTTLSLFSSQKTDYKIASQRLRLAHLRRRNPGKTVVEVQRDNLLADSRRFLTNTTPAQLRRRLYVKFVGEDGKDAGGVAREWFFLLSHSLCDPLDGMFEYSAADLSTLQIRPNSSPTESQLDEFRSIGRFLGLALFHGNLIDVFFIKPFYKMMLGQRISLQDFELVDAEFYRGLVYLLENPAEDLELTFSVGQGGDSQAAVELKPDGADIAVTDENKAEYVRLVLDWRLQSGVQRQMDALLRGFFSIINQKDIKGFSPSELELALCGIAKIDFADWKANTSYINGYEESSEAVSYFWEVLESWDTVMQTRFLQFVTGTSRVPAQGFGALQGTGGPCKFSIYRSGDSGVLPVGHTCINRLDLPPYTSLAECEAKLRMAVEETDGFGIE